MFESSPEWVPLRVTGHRRRINTWSMVLQATGVAHRVMSDEVGYTLLVRSADADRADGSLHGFEAEELVSRRAAEASRRRSPEPWPVGGWMGGVGLALALAWMFALTGPSADASVWFRVGSSSAQRVIDGEWWRAVTALTLHADTPHLLSNTVVGMIPVVVVLRTLGPGWGGGLVLLAGTLGNLLNALAHQARHDSIGFSTAVFGAVGMLGALEAVHQWRRHTHRRRVWIPAAASLALLLLMGANKESDVSAHLFGLIAGGVLGLMAGGLRWRPRSNWAQAVLAAMTVASMLGAWTLAGVRW